MQALSILKVIKRVQSAVFAVFKLGRVVNMPSREMLRDCLNPAAIPVSLGVYFLPATNQADNSGPIFMAI